MARMRMGQLAARKGVGHTRYLTAVTPEDAAFEVFVNSELNNDGTVSRREALLSYSVLASKGTIRCLWLDVEAELIRTGKIVI